MELLVILAIVVVVGALIYFNREAKGFDVNADGEVNAKDVKAAVKNAVEGVKQTADVNKDGKVNKQDVKAAVEKVRNSGRKPAAKKTTTRKPRATKATAK